MEVHRISKKIDVSTVYVFTAVICDTYDIMYCEHRIVESIIEWFDLERALKDHLVQATCHGQGHLALDQGAKSHIQSDLAVPMVGCPHFLWAVCSYMVSPSL